MEDGFGRPPAGARAAAMLREHGSALQAVARRWSVCQDDAEDAVQRGLEIYLRRTARASCLTTTFSHASSVAGSSVSARRR